jgi:hypothetical protein
MPRSPKSTFVGGEGSEVCAAGKGDWKVPAGKSLALEKHARTGYQVWTIKAGEFVT